MTDWVIVVVIVAAVILIAALFFSIFDPRRRPVWVPSETDFFRPGCHRWHPGAAVETWTLGCEDFVVKILRRRDTVLYMERFDCKPLVWKKMITRVTDKKDFRIRHQNGSECLSYDSQMNLWVMTLEDGRTYTLQATRGPCLAGPGGYIVRKEDDGTSTTTAGYFLSHMNVSGTDGPGFIYHDWTDKISLPQERYYVHLEAGISAIAGFQMDSDIGYITIQSETGERVNLDDAKIERNGDKVTISSEAAQIWAGPLPTDGEVEILYKGRLLKGHCVYDV